MMRFTLPMHPASFAAAFLLLVTSLSAKEEMVHLWSSEESGVSYQYCIEKEKLPTLRVIDILKENPPLDASGAARAAIKELRKRRPEIKDGSIHIDEVDLKIRSIGQTEFSHYVVVVNYMNADGEIRVAYISILLDGEPIPRLPTEEWRKVEVEQGQQKK